MAIIYWIHKENNEDYLTEGYIGITERVFEERLLDHKREAPNKHFQNAINKYGWDNLIKEVIFEGSEEDCLLFENYLRAEECVGWNVAIGGGKPPSWKGRKLTESHKNKVRIGNTGKKRSKETIDKLKIANKIKAQGENNSMFGKNHSEESILKIRISKLKYDLSIYKMIVDCKKNLRSLCLSINIPYKTAETIRNNYKKGYFEGIL